jgi:hypothetical protein
MRFVSFRRRRPVPPGLNGAESARLVQIHPRAALATFAGVNIFRIRDGKVAEIWNHRDDLGLAQQLGAPVYAGVPPQDD